MARRRSIVRAAALAAAFTVLLPIVALLVFESAISAYYHGESNLLTRLLKPALPYVRVYRQSESVSRRINVAILEDPDRLADPEFLRTLVTPGDNLALVLRVEDEHVRVVGRLRQDDLFRLPDFGARVDPESPPPDPESREAFVLDQTDFLTRDGKRASVFLVRAPAPLPPRTLLAKPLGFGRQLGFFLVIALLALNGGAGLFFIARLIRPLRTLEAAAHRLGSGELSIPVASPGVRELEPVFSAFDSMRQKLQAGIERERADARSRRDLIANLSHDVRTPLTAIRGYIDGLADGTAATPERRERYLGILREQAGRLERMIESIFLLSTLESGEDRPELRDLDLSEFLRSGAEELAALYAGRLDISIEISKEGAIKSTNTPLLLRADPMRLRRLVENLAANAAAHSGRTPAGFTISAREERDASGKPFVRLDFTDDGRGFPQSQAERIFERFYRGDEARSGEGAGLGLAIVREIVLSMGGMIEGSKGPGLEPWPGARITVRLPLSPSPESRDSENGMSVPSDPAQREEQAETSAATGLGAQAGIQGARADSKGALS